MLRALDDGALTHRAAVAGLGHCASLIRDGSLWYGWDEGLSHEMGHDILEELVGAAIGRSPGSYAARTTVPVGAGGGPVASRVSVIRGVLLGLDRGGCLVSIDIHPDKYRERRSVMAIVGIGSDPSPDVALRHDDYLAMQSPHGDG